jgi:hypothetical protein
MKVGESKKVLTKRTAKYLYLFSNAYLLESEFSVSSCVGC